MKLFWFNLDALNINTQEMEWLCKIQQLGIPIRDDTNHAVAIALVDIFKGVTTPEVESLLSSRRLY